ncbi:MAG: amidophosphoribosyltransferase [Oscillospiraceae bacterium]|nr:amidophosphoribosyltransferase [Oscillospiraceae bacterium]MDD4367446.1 amidophosphoribosyltransferase [Oscillospiraceae bacterium]
MSDKLHDECGVYGIFDVSQQREDAARMAYYGLFALQHRGQESAGICVNNQGKLFLHKEEGLVVEVFDEMTLNLMPGFAAIGHVRYPTQGGLGAGLAMPLLIKSRTGQIALAHNGTITNAEELRSRLEDNGAVFQTTSDSEVMLSLLARNRILTNRIEDAVFMMMAELKGSYSLTIMTAGKVIGVRDPLGIRPLCLGRLDNAYILASESCAIQAIGGTFIRDIDPGEVVTISKHGLASERMQSGEAESCRAAGRLCLFEFVYFARPDSTIDGCNVFASRYEAGKALAAQAPATADLVIGAPDSGLTAAMGFAEASGLPYAQGILKNRYVGRTFIQPTQMQRELAVSMKFSALAPSVKGKRLVMVDDSVVRGTTTRHVINMLKQAGALEVHMRVASPPVAYPCYYGIDTPAQEELSASHMSREALRQLIEADSLAFLSLAGLKHSLKGLTMGCCSSCFDGSFPAGAPKRAMADLKKVDLAAQGYPETDAAAAAFLSAAGEAR